MKSSWNRMEKATTWQLVESLESLEKKWGDATENAQSEADPLTVTESLRWGVDSDPDPGVNENDSEKCGSNLIWLGPL
jgi:hypothetical protein